jgi:hypothetical protein
MNGTSGSIWEPNQITPGWNGCRMSLSVQGPVTTADVTGATQLNLHPYRDNRIWLMDSAGDWHLRNLGSSYRAISLSGLAANTNHDVYAHWAVVGSGDPIVTMEAVAWTNDTTRATALAQKDGVYYKTGDYTKRWIGTIRTAGTAGQCEDSKTKRFCWNLYNQIPRFLYNSNATNHTYNAASFREWNGGTNAPRVQFVLGLAQNVQAEQQVVGADAALTRIALDTTTSGNTPNWYADGSTSVRRFMTLTEPFSVGVGLHYLTINEYSVSGTSNFYEAYLRAAIMG